MVQKVLRDSYGVSDDYFYQRDGSGMSRRNRIAPIGMISLLTAILKKSNHANYISYLPTLDYVFDGTPAQNMVHAKTGNLLKRCCSSFRFFLSSSP
jgi:D-alanyl-D-alanine carboxypeptidase